MWSKIDPNEGQFISYTGKLPAKLYRYRTVRPDKLDQLINFEIIEEAIYLAGLKDLNDPDEGRFLIKFRGSDADILDYLRQYVRDNLRKSERSTYPKLTQADIERGAKSLVDEVVQCGYIPPERVVTYTRYVLEHVIRVACFTTQPVNYSMWANYAKFIDPKKGAIDHGGVCLEYHCTESWRNTTLHPVEYSDSIPEINPLNLNESDLVNAFYMKSREWRCEDEWRIVNVIHVMPPFPANFATNSKMKLENSVASVIFGLNTPDYLIDDIRARVVAVKPEISFKKVIRNTRTFNRELVELK